MMTGNDRKELQEKKELLKVNEKSLRARKSATERQRKLRLKRKDAMDEIDPILRKSFAGKTMVLVVDHENQAIQIPLPKQRKNC